jgi:ABC-type glycerol-3-phosphate transport system substrate-binding protein
VDSLVHHAGFLRIACDVLIAEEDLDVAVEYAAAVAVDDQILEEDDLDDFVASLNDYCSLLGVPWVLAKVGFYYNMYQV